MKQIILNEQLYDIPTSWGEIKLKHQLKVNQDKKDIVNKEFEKISILSGYCNIPLQTLKRTQVSKLGELFRTIDFINTPIPQSKIHDFTHNGHKYYIAQNIKEMEFQDFVSLENAIDMYGGDDIEALPMVIAIMAKRKKKDGTLESLDDYDLNKRKMEFMDLPLIVANNILVFFCQAGEISKQIMALYSNPQVVVLSKMRELNYMLNRQVGRGLYTRLLNGILRTYLKFIERKLNKFFTSTPSK